MKSKVTSPSKTEPQIQAFIENRSNLRHPLIVLEVKWKHYDHVFLGQTKNISLGGLYMSTDRTLHVGERFPLEFILPNLRTKITCTGEVSWTRDYHSEGKGSQGVGIRFVDLDQRKIKAIQQWIKKQESRPKKKG